MTILPSTPAAPADGLATPPPGPFPGQDDQGAVPRPSTTLFGLAAIAAATAALASLAAGLFLLGTLARLGREGFSEFLVQARFDPLLKLQLGAGEISLLYLGLAGATLGTARLVGGRDWRRFVALGAAHPGRRRAAAICIVTLAYAATLTFGYAWGQERRTVADGPTDVLLLSALVGNYVVLAPLAEELLFRGWLYSGLRRRLGFAATFALTTTAFVAIHWDASHRRILLVLPLALALGLLREGSGSIKPTVMLHGCYNALIVGITLALS